jgi:hypothetical protein
MRVLLASVVVDSLSVDVQLDGDGDRLAVSLRLLVVLVSVPAYLIARIHQYALRLHTQTNVKRMDVPLCRANGTSMRCCSLSRARALLFALSLILSAMCVTN